MGRKTQDKEAARRQVAGTLKPEPGHLVIYGIPELAYELQLEERAVRNIVRGHVQTNSAFNFAAHDYDTGKLHVDVPIEQWPPMWKPVTLSSSLSAGLEIYDKGRSQLRRQAVKARWQPK